MSFYSDCYEYDKRLERAIQTADSPCNDCPTEYVEGCQAWGEWGSPDCQYAMDLKNEQEG